MKLRKVLATIVAGAMAASFITAASANKQLIGAGDDKFVNVTLTVAGSLPDALYSGLTPNFDQYKIDFDADALKFEGNNVTVAGRAQAVTGSEVSILAKTINWKTGDTALKGADTFTKAQIDEKAVVKENSATITFYNGATELGTIKITPTLATSDTGKVAGATKIDKTSVQDVAFGLADAPASAKAAYDNGGATLTIKFESAPSASGIAHIKYQIFGGAVAKDTTKATTLIVDGKAEVTIPVAASFFAAVDPFNGSLSQVNSSIYIDNTTDKDITSVVLSWGEAVTVPGGDEEECEECGEEDCDGDCEEDLDGGDTSNPGGDTNTGDGNNGGDTNTGAEKPEKYTLLENGVYYLKGDHGQWFAWVNGEWVESNPPTGVAVAIIPTLVAAAAAVVARKRK